MWLFFSLLSPLFWAIVHVLDEHCVDTLLARPWMGVVTSALASVIVYVPLAVLLSFTQWELPSWPLILLGFAIGALIQLAQAFYFAALSHSEAGIVAAYWNLTPAFLPVVSFLLFKQILGPLEYLGIVILILSSTWMCLLDSNVTTRLHPPALMTVASAIMVAVFLMENYLYRHSFFLISFLFVMTGLIVTGVMPLAFTRVRGSFRASLHTIAPAWKIFLGIEAANLLALTSSQLAMKLGIPSLVSAVQTMVPVYTFILSLILFNRTERFGAAETLDKLPWKISSVFLMIIGVLLVSYA
jgi:uncharacterized membrane protein